MGDESAEPAQRQDAGPPEEQESRRARELRSLYATARSLTALGELDEVLVSIVRHAHELMGSDITYLSTHDDVSDRITLRAVEGSISESFRSARVPVTTGVAARVSSTMAPAWVSDYLRAHDLTHDPEFDRVAEIEGIKALLGVPLLDGDVMRGWLFAADRAERSFAPDEIALLSAFADHAAVSLRNARIYQESQDALRRLQDAYRTIEGHVAEIERAARVHESLTSVVLSGGNSRDVIDVLVTNLGGSATVLDRFDSVAARAPHDGAAPEVDSDVRDALAAARASGRCTLVRGPDGTHRGVAAILAGDSALGAVLHSRDTPLAAEDAQTLERTAQILGLLILRHDAVSDAQERARGELLAEILDSSASVDPGTMERASSRGIQLGAMNAIVCVSSAAIPVPRVVHFLSSEFPMGRGLVAQRHDKAVLLISADDLDEVATRLHTRLAAVFQEQFIVCAGPFKAVREPRRADVTVTRCVDLLLSLGREHAAATTSELEAYSLILDPSRQQELTDFMHRSLGPLVEYDRRRQAGLVTTLHQFFAQGGNSRRTARALHIHVNTLAKRLQRISSLIGDDWADPPRSVSIELATHMYRLMTDRALPDSHLRTWPGP